MVTVQRDGSNSLIEPNLLKKSLSQGQAGVDTINDPKHVSYTQFKWPDLGMGKVVTQVVVGAKTFTITIRLETSKQDGNHAQLVVLQTGPIPLPKAVHPQSVSGQLRA